MRGLNLIPNLIGGGFRINVGGLCRNATHTQRYCSSVGVP